MEYKIGEIFKFNGKKIRCVLNNGSTNVCEKCALHKTDYYCTSEIACTPDCREDVNDVYFIEIKENDILSRELNNNEKHIAEVFEKVGLAKVVRELANDKLTIALQNAMIELSEHQNTIKQDTEIRDIWEYVEEWRKKFGRLPKDTDELVACINYIMKRKKPVKQKSIEWSDVDDIRLNEAIEMIESNGRWIRSEDAVKLVSDWLKSIKDRCIPQKQELSEKDYMRLMIATEIYTNGLINPDGTYTVVSSDAAIQHADSLIKSLKK